MILATLCYIKQDGKTIMVHHNKKPNDIHAGKWQGLGVVLLRKTLDVLKLLTN